MTELLRKIANFFTGEEFFEKEEDARLEMTPSDLRQIVDIVRENTRLKAEIKRISGKDGE